LKYENLIKEENELNNTIEKMTDEFELEKNENNLKLMKYFNYEQQFLIDNKNEIIDRKKLKNIQYQINENFDFNILNEMFKINIEEKQIKINGYSLIFNCGEDEVIIIISFINFLFL
jgi:hypothetical protein